MFASRTGSIEGWARFEIVGRRLGLPDTSRLLPLVEAGAGIFGQQCGGRVDYRRHPDEGGRQVGVVYRGPVQRRPGDAGQRQASDSATG